MYTIAPMEMLQIFTETSFDEFNPLSKVSSCGLEQILRNQEKTAPIAYYAIKTAIDLFRISAMTSS